MKSFRKKQSKTYKATSPRSTRSSTRAHRNNLVRLHQPGPSSQLLEDVGDSAEQQEDNAADTPTAPSALSSFRKFVEGPKEQDDAQKLVATLTSSKILRSPGNAPGSDSEEGFEAASMETSRGLMRGRASSKASKKGKTRAVSCRIEIFNGLEIEQSLRKMKHSLSSLCWFLLWGYVLR